MDTGLLTIPEAKEFLRENGVPVKQRGGSMTGKPSDDSHWPYVQVGDEVFINQEELLHLARMMPRWLFCEVNRDLEHRGGYMPIPHVEREFGLTRKFILEAVESNKIIYWDRGEGIHPVLRYLISRFSANELVQKMAGEDHDDTHRKEGDMESQTITKFCETQNLSYPRLTSFRQSGILPWFKSNGLKGRAARVEASGDDIVAILKDAELMAALRGTGRMPKALRERLLRGELVSSETDGASDEETPPLPQAATPEAQVPTPTPVITPGNGNGNSHLTDVQVDAHIGRSFQVVQAVKAALARGTNPRDAVRQILIK